MSSHLLIREARRRARLTQAELAARAGTTQSAVARWEAGKALPSLEKLRELVDCCGLELVVSLAQEPPTEREIPMSDVARSPEARLARLMAALPSGDPADDTADATGHPGGDARFDPLAVLATLSRHDVRYVLMGGLAATLHGSRFLITEIEITPERSTQNLRRLAEALTDLGAHPTSGGVGQLGEAAPVTEAHSTAAVRRINTHFGMVDVVLEPAGTNGFEDLRLNATTVNLRGTRVPVASLGDIIRSKEASNSAADKDIIESLRRLQQLSHRSRRDRSAE